MANRETLQKNLNANYDLEFFQRNVLHPVFGNSLTLASIPEKRNINASEERLIKSVKKYGTITLADYRELDLYDVELAGNVVIERSKVSIGAAIKKYIFANNAVLVNFHYQNQPAKSWRLSFIAKEQQIEEGEIIKGETNPKRYTYVLGQNETCRTAAERFTKLSLDGEFTIDKFKEAFSVEKLSKTFFEEYKEHYLHFVEHLGKRNFKATVFNGDEKAIRDFGKKLLGRIVFLYFVQKKNWLGASNTNYTDGSANFLEELFISSGKNENFYNQWLKKLFYDSLNNPNRTDENFKTPDGKIVKIPFLNGGLFEDDDPKGILTFPPKLFSDLFEFFKQYNFTIYEDSPDDHTVAVDPEMLGHIFENLLEDNKDKGAFYTPKEIVHYMCQESLIEYLSTKLSIADTTTFQQLGKEQTEIFGNDGKKGQLAITQEHKSKSTGITRADVEQFIKHKQVTDEIKKNEKDINKHLDTIKICDPAIGSGAFPMGLLHEIFNAKLVLNSDTGINAAEVKQNIIQNSIYGVDIEQGAVDIARLRFWLSLIVDEDKPRPLPNLDYKIVVGDSLVPKFEGEVVDIDWDLREAVGEAKPFVEKIKNGLNEIVEAQKKFFSEENPDRKKKFAEKIRNLKIDLLINQLTFDKLKYKAKNSISQQLFEQTNKDRQRELEIKMKIAGYDDTIKKLQVLKSKPTKQLNFFDWKLEFSEIMNPAIAVDKCGFDIVIANPPYLKERDNAHIFEKVNQSEFGNQYHQGKMDYWFYFLHKAIDAISKNGTISFITSRYWLNSQGAKKLIQRVRTNLSFKSVVDIGKLKVFDNVAGHHMIAVYSKRKSSLFKYKKLSNEITDIEKEYKTANQDILILENDSVFKSNDEIIFTGDSFNTNAKTLLLDELYEVGQGVVEATDKVSKKQLKLSKRTDVNSGQGVFVLKENEFRSLKLSSKEKAICKNYLDPNDIEKYSIQIHSKKYLIYSDKETKELIKKNGDYQNLKTHLNFFKPFITSSNKPYGLHRPREEKLFTSPKIIFKGMFVTNQFAYDDECYYFGFSFSSVIQKNENYSLKYLLALLNSRYALNWFYSNGKLRGAGVDIGVEKLRLFPVALLKNQNVFTDLVDEIIERKKTNGKTSNLENKIDLMVYKLYQLTYDEVLTVDKEFEKEMSREEYEKKDFGFEYVQPETTAQVKTNGKQKGKNLNLDMLKDLEF